MKKILIATMIASMLAGCSDDPKTEQQIQFEQQQQLMRMNQQHELEMAKVQAGVYNKQPEVYVQPSYQEPQYEQQQQYTQPVYSAPEPNYQQNLGQPQYATASNDSGSSALGTIGTLAAGAAAGYVLGELLDSGHRTYTASNGRVVYVDKTGREISKSDYERFRRENPVKSKVSDANLKSKQVINTTATKTADVTKQGYQNVKQTTQKAAASTKAAASKASQTVRTKASSYKSSTTTKRK